MLLNGKVVDFLLEPKISVRQFEIGARSDRMMQNNSNSEKGQFHDSNVDALDLQIIRLLQQDGRMAYSQLSRELGIPEATVRYRVKRLVDDEIITISAFLNTGKLKYDTVAYLEIEVCTDFYGEFLAELVAMENISYISAVTGEFNIMLEYIYESNDDLLRFITWLKQQPDVKRLNSKVLLKIFKAQYPIRVHD